MGRNLHGWTKSSWPSSNVGRKYTRCKQMTQNDNTGMVLGNPKPTNRNCQRMLQTTRKAPAGISAAKRSQKTWASRLMGQGTWWQRTKEKRSTWCTLHLGLYWCNMLWAIADPLDMQRRKRITLGNIWNWTYITPCDLIRYTHKCWGSWPKSMWGHCWVSP